MGVGWTCVCVCGGGGERVCVCVCLKSSDDIKEGLNQFDASHLINPGHFAVPRLKCPVDTNEAANTVDQVYAHPH